MIDIEKDKLSTLPSMRRCVSPIASDIASNIASSSTIRFRSALVAGRRMQSRRQDFIDEQ